MSKIIDITGQRFGRLVVIGRVPSKTGRRETLWRCKCDCGNETVVSKGHLTTGHTQSCGCYHKDRSHEPRPSASKHYLSKSRIYRIWSGMIDRSTNPKSKEYKNYMGRGIGICEEWKTFTNFRNWAFSHGYADNLSIDRIDNNGNYEPSNCRWADAKTQGRNTRANVFVTYKGETHTLVEWSEIKGISYNRVHQRIKSGWSFEDAVETPVRGYNRV